MDVNSDSQAWTTSFCICSLVDLKLKVKNVYLSVFISLCVSVYLNFIDRANFLENFQQVCCLQELVSLKNYKKKCGVSIFFTLAYVSSKNIIDIPFYWI